MKIDVPLKPPEFKRDEMGRFDRRGGDLIKKRGVIKRNTEGQFEKGTHGGPRAGAGRPPGSKNKTTLALREAILAALDKVGGSDYLAKLAIENSSAFASLLARVLPHTLAADPDSGGGGPIEFRRIIVYPGGREEIEGVTPKQLPAPSSQALPKSDQDDVGASHALPRPTDPTDDTKGAV